MALAVAMVLPFSSVGAWFGFAQPSLAIVLSMIGLVIVYLIAAELMKKVAIGRH
jgi:Mg2+-importing ATPase